MTTIEAMHDPVGTAPPAASRWRAPRWWTALHRSGLTLVAPFLLLLVLLFYLPIARIFWQSLNEHSDALGQTQYGVNLENYRTLFTDGFTLRVVLRTLLIGLVVAGITGLLAYPYAYMMTLVQRRMRAVLVTLVLVPLWTSVLARTFAWVIILGPNGPVDDAFHVVPKGDIVAVTISMTQVLLPFMVLPMYSTMQGIDRRLMAAGASLGANRRQTFWRVYFPLSLPGVITGFTLVFVLTLGFYLTPALLGNTQQAVIAQLIILRVNLLDFGQAGALGIFVLAVTLLVLAAGARLARRRGTRVRIDATGAGTAVRTTALPQEGDES
jgi:ABC-type spermidine/putrescine transport system permease subunit I